jgi:hypothetical protein
VNATGAKRAEVTTWIRSPSIFTGQVMDRVNQKTGSAWRPFASLKGKPWRLGD